MARDLPGEFRTLATVYPEFNEGTSCSKVAFKVRKKTFVFVEQKQDDWNAMIKLSDSLAEAETLAKKTPDNISVGKHGWVTLRFANGKGPSKSVLKRWVDESFRLMAPKKLLAMLD